MNRMRVQIKDFWFSKLFRERPSFPNDVSLYDIMWKGNPTPKRLSDTTRLAMGSGVFFLLAVIALIYEIFLQNNKIRFLYIMLSATVVISIVLIFVLPALELRIRKNTIFIITQNEVITLVGRKIKITQITKSLSLVIQKYPMTCMIGFNVNNKFIFDQINPVVEYLMWDLEKYMHIFYDIEGNEKDIVQIIEKLKNRNNLFKE